MIDRQQLIDMMDGDAEIADKFIAAFKEKAREQLPLIKKYVANQNWPMLSNAVHVMKTQAGYMGLKEIQRLAAEIEHKIDAHQSEENGDPQNIQAMTKSMIEKIVVII